MRVLYIVGDSRSGSTLLQYLMAQQSGVVALGEVRRLHSLFVEDGLCACGEYVSECPFWLAVQKRLGRPLGELATRPDLPGWRRRYGQLAGMASLMLGRGSGRTLRPREREVANDCMEVYRVASEITGADVLIDSSKVPEQFLYLRLLAGESVKPVFLFRDGRAVVWSKLKRYPDVEPSRHCIQWKKLSLMMLALRRALPPGERGIVRYEEVCQSPQEAIRDIVGQTPISEPASASNSLIAGGHALGGSPSFRRQAELTVALDEGWRSEMPAGHLKTFDRIAGPLNRRLGYG